MSDGKILVRDPNNILLEVGYGGTLVTPMPVSITGAPNGLTITGTVSTVLAIPEVLSVQATTANGMTVNGSFNATVTFPAVQNVQAATINGLTVTGTLATTPSSQPQPVLAAVLNGLTVTGTLATTPSSQPQPVQAATANGLTINGAVTANQGGAPWSTTISGTAAVSGSLGRTWALSPSTDGVTVMGTVSLAGQPILVQAPTSNGLTINGSVSISGTATVAGTVTANQGGAPWSVSQSGAWTVTQADIPLRTRDISNPPVQVSGGMLQGISNTVAVSGSLGRSWTLSPSTDGVTVMGTVSIGGQPLLVQSPTANGLTINGTVTATIAQPITVQSPVANGLTTARSWTLSSGTDSVAATQSGTWNVNNLQRVLESVPIQASTSNGLTVNGSLGRTWTLSPSTDGISIMGTATVLQGVIPWTVQAPTANGLTINGSVSVSNTVAVSGSLGRTWALSPSTDGVTVMGAVTIGGQPLLVQSPVTNGLTVNVSNSVTVTGTVTANQGGAPWSTTISGTPSVTVSGNPDVQISGGTLTGISNTVTVSGTVAATQSGSWNLASVLSAVPVQAATANGLTINGAVTVASTTITGTVASTQSGTWNVNNLQRVLEPVPMQASTANGLTINGTVTSNQGTAAAASSGWPVKITDGTDTVGISTVSGAKALKVDVAQSVTVPAGLTPVQAATLNGMTVLGALTHNNAAPAANNVGALVAVASVAAPTYIEGDQVLLSTTLGGAVRISGTISASSSATATADNPSYTEGDTAAAFSQDLKGNLRVQAAALVDETSPSLTPGTVKPISMTSDGRLRVVTLTESYNFPNWDDGLEADPSDREQSILSPWG